LIKVNFKARNQSTASVSFAASSTGGSPILGTTVRCRLLSGSTTVQASGKKSPLIVGKLKAGSTYSCTAQVSNAVGTSRPSVAKRFVVVATASR
jgi:hypothetical protein